MTSDPDTTRAKVLELVRRHGWNATAFQTLERGYSYFFHGDHACVAYVDTGGSWVAAGAPIAAHEELAAVTRAFVLRARAAGKRCSFFATEQRFRDAVGPELDYLLIGEQPVWDPCDWPEIVAGHRSLREQLRRARAKGVTTRELAPSELESGPTREAIGKLVERWLSTRSLAPMAFLVHIDVFDFASERRCFVAEQDGKVVGFAGMVPVPARGGWMLEDLLRDPAAPNGTGELLIDRAMHWAAEADSHWLTLGLAPLAGDVNRTLRAVRNRSTLLFDFHGLRAYKAKLRPREWSPIELAHPATQSSVLSVYDALAAFTGGGFVRFGLRTLLRGPTAVVRVLALLLVPWTLLLAAAPAQLWFGSALAKWSWVVFDALLAAGLFRLARRPKLPLLTLLACCVTIDAALTLAQALLFNSKQLRGVGDLLIVLVACAAPALAAVVLWGARRTLRLGSGSPS